MTAFLANMLLGRIPTDVPKVKGRVVSSGCSESDIRLTTGSMRERVLGFLYLNGIPSVSRDIATGIKSNPSRVTKTLSNLIERGEVEAIKLEGCVMEYTLTTQGVKTIKSIQGFMNLRM